MRKNIILTMTMLAAIIDATPALATKAIKPARAVDPVIAAASLRDKALAGNAAYGIVAGLTTEIGQRLAGTPPEARARAWLAARMTALGLANVRVQTFDVPRWERGTETADVLGDAPQKLIVTALGYSGATPAAGIDAEVVRFADLDGLKAAPAGSLTGKIAFVGHGMSRAQDGSGYGAFNATRTAGPAIAAGKGAAAYLLRSLGTGTMRDAHTGVTRFEPGATPIPAGALSVPDAEQLDRLVARGPVRLHLVLTPRMTGTGTSGNVIGEITGAAAPREVVLIGGHLDSWDLGTGAIDDGAGVAITLAAAKLIADGVRNGSLPRPRRTIRVVAFGDEEAQGPLGGATYLKATPGDTVVLAAESDFGADRVWSLRTHVAPGAMPVMAALARVLAPLGVAPSPGPAHGGTDIEAAVEAGAGVVDLAQDGTRYFDLHHTADDTLDKIDARQMDQNVAAWAAMLWFAADSDVDFRVPPVAAAAKP